MVPDFVLALSVGEFFSGREKCLRTVGAQSAYVSDSALCDAAAVQ